MTRRTLQKGRVPPEGPRSTRRTLQKDCIPPGESFIRRTVSEENCVSRLRRVHHLGPNLLFYLPAVITYYSYRSAEIEVISSGLIIPSKVDF